jgi:mRNA interferase RelE/StbE
LTWTIEFLKRADKDIERLAPADQKRILKMIYERVIAHEDPYELAEPLFGHLSGYHRFRCGDYRVICTIQKKILTIIVVRIAHRKEVYKMLH